MSAQHTPGPFDIFADERGITIKAGGQLIARMASAKDLENAQLFAAAPDLLAALDDLLAFHDHTHPRHRALFEDYQEDCIAIEVAAKSSDLLDDLQRDARDAIAKARGQ